MSAPALLSRCDGNYQLALGPEAPGGKPDAKPPAAKIGPGVLQVEAVSFPKLRRGGELVELRLTVPRRAGTARDDGHPVSLDSACAGMARA